MTRRYRLGGRVVWVLGLVLACGMARAKEEPLPPQFKYAGGTENLTEGCEGNLELNPEAMKFKCWGGAVEIPYSDISLMQYRSDISRKVRKLKVKWKVRPSDVSPILRSKKNRFFAVVFRDEGKPRVVILRVEPKAMRPYLAELDLRAAKRVEVESYEEY
jgi:hypothetical protein